MRLPSYKHRRILGKVQRHRSRETDQKWKQETVTLQEAHTARAHVPADRADKCDCDMAPVFSLLSPTPHPPLRCRKAPSYFHSWKLRRKDGRERRRPKERDVPQPATSEAEAL